MHKGYKTYRAFINAKLHGLSIVICGSRSVLDDEILKRLNQRVPPAEISKSLSTKMLTDKEAVIIYNDLIQVANRQESLKKKANQILETDDLLTSKQRNAIICICKYTLKWKPESTYNYIMKSVPGLKMRIKSKSKNLNYLFSNLKKFEADKVIKRLDMLIKRNEFYKSK